MFAVSLSCRIKGRRVDAAPELKAPRRGGIILFLQGPFCCRAAGKIPVRRRQRASEGPVKVALPQQRSDVVEYEDVRGQTKAYRSVDLHCRVSGYLKSDPFRGRGRCDRGATAVRDRRRALQGGPRSSQGRPGGQDRQSQVPRGRIGPQQSLPAGAISQSDLDKSVAAQAEAVAEVSRGQGRGGNGEIRLGPHENQLSHCRPHQQILDHRGQSRRGRQDASQHGRLRGPDLRRIQHRRTDFSRRART